MPGTPEPESYGYIPPPAYPNEKPVLVTFLNIDCFLAPDAPLIIDGPMAYVAFPAPMT